MTADDLFAQYLIRRREERKQRVLALALSGDADLLRIQVAAHEAELLNGLLADLKELDKDPGKFIKEKLQ